MATRSTVTLHATGKPAIHLYRHWDGGPWGNGSTLAKLLRKHKWTITGSHMELQRIQMRFAEELVRRGRFDSVRGLMQYDYELTPSADWHGDTEWHYDVFFTADGESPAVRVNERTWTDQHGDKWTPVVGGTVAMFRRYLAEWQRGALKRMRELRSKRKPAIDAVAVRIKPPAIW